MPDGYYRFPTIYRDTIVFVSEDDLWSVPAQGGIARRLTSNLGEVSRPWFSPDGTQLAFVGREEGRPEIYLMPSVGGPARRLTYLGATNTVTVGWTSDGKILFASTAGHWYLRFTHLYQVDVEGNAPEQLNFGLARSIAYGPDGGVVIGRNTEEPARWKRYRGGTAGQIWIDELGDGNFHPLLNIDSNVTSPIWLGQADAPGRIYFISDHEGIGNLYSVLPSGEDLQRHTHHEDFYVRNASSDGQRIVYHAGADLCVYDPQKNLSSIVKIEYHSPQTQRNRKYTQAAQYLQDADLHPKGQALAITTRGKVFSFSNWEGSVRQHGQIDEPAGNHHPTTAVRYRMPAWLPDGRRFIAITDAGGEESFVIFSNDGKQEPQLLANLDIGRPDAVKVNPKKNQVVFSNHRYELMFLDLETKELRQIDRSQSAPVSGFDWSPDGEWVAYSVSISLQVQALKLWKVSTNEIYPLTHPVLRDIAPAFDPKGKYLYFLSYRTFDPVYDNLHFDLGFPLGMKPYLIPLKKSITNPFIPVSRLSEDESEKEPEADDGAAQEQKDKSEAEPEENEEKEEKEEKKEDIKVEIDLEDIFDRVIAFPVAEGIYGRIQGVGDNKVIYSRFPIQGAVSQSDLDAQPPARGSLFTYTIEDQKEELYCRGISDFSLTPDGKTLLYRAGNRLRVLKASEKPAEDDAEPGRKSGWIDFNRLKISILPGAEWRQMFREAWRLQRDQFWTPDMSKVDWLTIHDRYLPLVDRVSSRSEFSDLMWEMQGELGTSHAYEFGGDYRPQPSYSQGFLGADFQFDPQHNAWLITHIYHGDVWDPSADSPLHQPGINVQQGDWLLEVNGRRLTQALSPHAALTNLAGEEVDLVVLPGTNSSSDPDNVPKPRSLTVTTLSNEMQVRYREWVEQNRRRVHEATNGKVGYLHIPDMGGWGYAEFHRGFLAEVDRDGLVVDLRFNRGGHVSSLLLEKLARKRIGYDHARWGQHPVPFPPKSVLGSMVALTNEYAGSDGDIFSQGFKLMKLGPLLGKRTWGGVIGIWPRHSLVDGTITTQPEFSFWFQDVGWGVENYGVDPDIEVDITPQDYRQSHDAQLERAILEVTRLLEANPPRLPDWPERPSRALPLLPK